MMGSDGFSRVYLDSKDGERLVGWCVERKICVNTGWDGEALGVGKHRNRFGGMCNASFQTIVNTLKEIQDTFCGEL